MSIEQIDDNAEPDAIFAPAPNLIAQITQEDDGFDGITIEQAREVIGALDLDDRMRYTLTREDVEHDNLRRANIAWVALRGYADIVYGDPEPEPVKQAMSDMLGDLMHLADALGLDFDSLVETARSHYEPETRGEL